MRIKLIWDLRGPDAEQTAKHHAIHLKEYADKHLNESNTSGVEKQSEMHSIAYMICDREQMIEIRDALKPHRAVEA